ncbi:DNA-binding protein [Methanoplanus endosymbiosus]|uniref:DNA-binding protein L6E24_01165 n=1 Tax=Methanoplanus endosymbiosus TaxID=33865 RepID=A0A9E7PPN9_9EURY|nr:DNA-binding protein [Methanoplanus endosymbiosus]UUX92769.1 DNA-binding protein [Methanoplanus endosymbiosus]
MGDDELAELRRRRMEEMRQQQMGPGAAEAEMERRNEAEAQIRTILTQILEPEARERLNTIRMTKPEFARAVEQQLVMLAQSGRVKSRISDAQLKQLLSQLVPQKKDFNITRR